MFNQFTRYVLDQWLPQTSTSAEGVETTNTSSSLRLPSTSTTDLDDDWVLVDANDSEGNSTCSSIDDLETFEDGIQLVERAPDRVVVVELPAPAYAPMAESWFLTPPPCFISTGPPVQVETSPMENLLIEHPSMSVYTHHHARRLYDRTVTPEPQTDVEEVADEDDPETVVLVRPTARGNRVHVLQIQERQGIKGKHAQKVQTKQACKNINRGSLNRTNKARELNSRNRRQRRGERSQGATRSFANNNRKC